MSLVIGAIILWIVPIFVANSIGKAKNRSGVAYGLFLGWIGVIILALLAPAEPITLANIDKHRNRFGDRQYRELKEKLIEEERRYRECPFCKEQIRSDATACPHCQRDVEPSGASVSP